MHDPLTVAHEIKYPWKTYPQSKSGKSLFEDGYRTSFITIWHKDPCTDHTDDSCGWFMRSRHGDPKVLEKIVKRFEWDWDRTFTSDGTGKVYFCGYFYPEDAGAGMPNMGVTAIVLNLFFLAALEMFPDNNRRKKASAFCQINLFEIMMFAENPTDSLRDGIIRKWGTDTKRDERIQDIASSIYGWILRQNRPWYRHPKWHVWHWEIQCHPLQQLKRILFSRCCKCGGSFRWNESVCSSQWDSEGPCWFKGEKSLECSRCSGPVCASEPKTV